MTFKDCKQKVDARKKELDFLLETVDSILISGMQPSRFDVWGDVIRFDAISVNGMNEYRAMLNTIFANYHDVYYGINHSEGKIIYKWCELNLPIEIWLWGAPEKQRAIEYQLLEQGEKID